MQIHLYLFDNGFHVIKNFRNKVSRKKVSQKLNISICVCKEKNSLQKNINLNEIADIP